MTSPESLTFMMGTFEATFPTDRSYSKLHQWIQPIEENRYRIGLTDYSVRLLKDVYFLDWLIDEGVDVQYKQEIGEVESAKAVSALYAPIGGQDIQFNQALMNDPSLINSSTYEKGWLFELTSTDPMLTAEEYLAILDENWKQAQRVIKGQIQ